MANGEGRVQVLSHPLPYPTLYRLPSTISICRPPFPRPAAPARMPACRPLRRFRADCDTRQLLLRRRRDSPVAKGLRVCWSSSRQSAARHLEGRAAGTPVAVDVRRGDQSRGSCGRDPPRARRLGHQPVFLRTVYRFGYRFVGEVEESRATTRAARRVRGRAWSSSNRQIVLLEGSNVIGRAPDAAVQCERRACRATTHGLFCRQRCRDAGRSRQQERHLPAGSARHVRSSGGRR